jgi:hypothetical protein
MTAFHPSASSLRLYAASFVTASATARALRSSALDRVTLVAMGNNAVVRTDEDALCAIHLRNLLLGRSGDVAATRPARAGVWRGCAVFTTPPGRICIRRTSRLRSISTDMILLFGSTGKPRGLSLGSRNPKEWYTAPARQAGLFSRPSLSFWKVSSWHEWCRGCVLVALRWSRCCRRCSVRQFFVFLRELQPRRLRAAILPVHYRLVAAHLRLSTI